MACSGRAMVPKKWRQAIFCWRHPKSGDNINKFYLEISETMIQTLHSIQSHWLSHHNSSTQDLSICHLLQNNPTTWVCTILYSERNHNSIKLSIYLEQTFSNYSFNNKFFLRCCFCRAVISSNDTVWRNIEFWSGPDQTTKNKRRCRSRIHLYICEVTGGVGNPI